MHALEQEPEMGQRTRVVGAGALVALCLFGSVALAAQQIRPREHAVRTQPTRVQMVRLKDRPPEVQSAPTAPAIPEAAPSPKPPPRPRKRLAKRPSKPKAQPMPSATPPPAAAQAVAAPLVVGLTLSSTSRRGRGPKYAVGNTLMGATQAESRQASNGVSVHSSAAPSEPALAKADSSRKTRKTRKAAKLLNRLRPDYPAAAKRRGLEGVVVLTITIDAQGRVESARVLRGLGSGLDESALSAARRTKWSPASVGSQPVRSTRRFNVRFSLHG